MGVFEVTGPHAAYFLNLVTTNEVKLLRPGQSQYSYLLAPDGTVIDDLMVYMLDFSRYVLVVNAANAEKDWAWLQAVNNSAVCIDEERPWVRGSFQAELHNLGEEGEDRRLADLALQGPRSRDILLAWLDTLPQEETVKEIRAQLLALKRTAVMECRLPSHTAPKGFFDLIIARTGYTGENMAYELLLHPDVLAILWRQLMKVGAPLGLVPVGLAARDSLRIEAGLPLYGHELAGPLGLFPDDAGFAGYVKLTKAFFIGRRRYIAHAEERNRAIIRFHIEEKGVRVPKQEDIVTEKRGRIIGEVTSCAVDTEGHLVGLASVDRRYTKPGTPIGVFPRPNREDWNKPYDALEVGDKLVMYEEAEVISRFP
jgi:glycine hydroxymethyltransferase